MRLIAFVITFYSNSIFGQDSSTIQSFKIYSNILKEERYFQAYVPSPSAKKLEVVYVLDGQAQFKTVVNVLKQLGDNKKLVVGVGNIWLRDRDYTISHVRPSAVMDSAAAAVSGGAPQFVAHLEKEVIPYINSNFPADASRVIVGHSLGGLVAMDMLLHHPTLFHNYIIIDPSIWWDNSMLLKQFEQSFGKNRLVANVFLAIANTKNKKNNIDEIRNDSTQNTALTRPTILLLDYLKARASDQFKFDSKFYKDDDHFSVFEAAVKDGLKLLVTQN